MRTVEWIEAGNRPFVRMIDQKALPWELRLVELETVEAVAAAITDMTVRGAPAIGASAAFGMALAAWSSTAETLEDFQQDLRHAGQLLKASRPTAVNLAWGVDQLLRLVDEEPATLPALRERLKAAAQQIADDDVTINQKMGKFGAALIQDGDTVLHHCNTGALAAVDYGTALGVVRAAFEQGKSFHVLLDETRPRLQGARLSAWELEQLGVAYDILPDTAAGHYMQRGEIKLVLVGADRIAANGDTANKIGTYQIAVLAKEHAIPFYVVAPTSTIDLTLKSGAEIPIEERDKSEVLAPFGHAIAPLHFKARNPAFDVTPHRYISGIVTEYGIVSAPFEKNLARVAAGKAPLPTPREV